MSVQAYASDVATVPKGHVMNSTGESRESWCSKKDAWETQMGQQRQRRDTRNNLSDIIGLGGVYKSKPKRQNRFMRYLQEKNLSDHNFLSFSQSGFVDAPMFSKSMPLI